MSLERPSFFQDVIRAIAGSEYRCDGCKRLEDQFTLRKASHHHLAHGPRSLRPIQLHKNFQELEDCVHCLSCRVFRQALFLRQITLTDATRLSESTEPIFVNLRSTPAPVLRIFLGDLDESWSQAEIRCTEIYEIDKRKLPQDPLDIRNAEAVRRWSSHCRKNHPECQRAWSSRNPTRLLRIGPSQRGQVQTTESLSREVRLVPGSTGDDRLEYVALSYCWGDQSDNGRREILQNGMTTSDNIAERMNGFHSSILPQTIQDAIELVFRLGVEYLWIDSICIIQQGDNMEDFQREAPIMHEVYGNASFTLSICSNESATEPMFRSRKAWKYVPQPCRMSEYFLSADDLTIDEIRQRCPLAVRGWTLQEECLSRRKLYWTGQRMYWSCMRERSIETGSEMALEIAVGEEFLEACWEGQREPLHRAWWDIVESYCRRTLTNKADRYAAISGVAARYAHAVEDQYLAGLWRETFVQDLCWSVEKIATGHDNRRCVDMAPSWSWVSVPSCSLVKRGAQLRKVGATPNKLILLEVCDSPIKRKEPETSDKGSDVSSDPTSNISRGQGVKKARVSGRMREFWGKESIFNFWDDVVTVDREGILEFSFNRHPEQNTHAVDHETGRVVVYSNHRKELVGQLDHIEEVITFRDPDILLKCLEVCDGAMLLLKGSGPGVFSRVGIIFDSRGDFFSNARTEELWLI